MIRLDKSCLAEAIVSSIFKQKQQSHRFSIMPMEQDAQDVLLMSFFPAHTPSKPVCLEHETRNHVEQTS